MSCCKNNIKINNCCGIIGYVGAKKPAVDFILEGLSILQNRGYDSAGICTIGNKTKDLKISKYASTETTSDAIDILEKKAPIKHKDDLIGIGHTRWATHGGKTDNNAHPHIDSNNRVSLVHNGVIENMEQIIKKYKFEKILKTETDSEIIVQLIGHFLEKGEPILKSIRLALKQLEGTWGLAIVCKDTPDKIYCTRKGSPLILGVSKSKETFVASESSAFGRYTRSMISLENEELAIISPNGVDDIIDLNEIEECSSPSIYLTNKNKDFKKRVKQSQENEIIQLSPSPYPHWTIKEIMEQPQSVSRALNFGGRIFDDTHVKLGGLEININWLSKIKHLIIASCGTSYYASLYGAKLFRNLQCFETVQCFDAAELVEEDFPLNDAGLLVISQSGETSDVMRCLEIAEKKQIPTFSVVNRVGSLIARTTGCGVYINAGREIAVASTKAFTSQVTVLTLISIFFAQFKNHIIDPRMKRKNSTPGTPISLLIEKEIGEINENIIDDDNNNNNDDNIGVKYLSKKKELEHKKLNMQLRFKLISSLHKLPMLIGMTLNRVRERCKLAASYLINYKTIFILGKGLGDCIAKEGALKIKEITYTHAEGYASGALKHGPFALIEKGTPIIIICLNDKFKGLNITAACEVKARGAHVIAITDMKKSQEIIKPLNPKYIKNEEGDSKKLEKICDQIIRVPSNGMLTALQCVIPLQLIAYEMAIQKKINPDKPKNLAKTVTVF